MALPTKMSFTTPHYYPKYEVCAIDFFCGRIPLSHLRAEWIRNIFGKFQPSKPTKATKIAQSIFHLMINHMIQRGSLSGVLFLNFRLKLPGMWSVGWSEKHKTCKNEGRF